MQLLTLLQGAIKKKGSVIDRIKLKKERAQHYALIYAERVEYHTLRRHAQEHPDKVISMIVDSCSKWKTELPRFTRELKLGKFSAHENSLCTCLVYQNKEHTRNPGDNQLKDVKQLDIAI